MIQSLIQMLFAPDKVNDAMNILLSIVERIRAENGCVSCSVYTDKENENQIIFTQVWKSDNDLQRHLRSDEYKKVLLIMEMACERPKIRFDNIVSTSGVETIEKARGK